MIFVCPESLDCELCFLSLQAAMLAMLAIGVFTFGSPNHALAARSGGRASGHFRSSSSRVHSSGSRTTRIGGSVGGGSGTLDITSQSDVMCFMIMGGTVAILELKKKYANKKLGLTTGEHVEIKGIRKWISTPSTPRITTLARQVKRWRSCRWPSRATTAPLPPSSARSPFSSIASTPPPGCDRAGHADSRLIQRALILAQSVRAKTQNLIATYASN
jgi:hypothetical protein